MLKQVQHDTITSTFRPALFFTLYLSQIFVNITNENLKISIIITLLMEEKNENN